MKRSKFSEAQRLRQLEGENAKLKRLLAEAMLDNAVLKEVTAKMVTPATRREAVAYLEELFEVNQQRACDVLGVDRTTVRYRSQRNGFVERLASPAFGSMPGCGMSA
jgi:putative transposase